MFIQTEPTPNPATLKFLPGQDVLDVGTADFPSAEAAAKSPLAQRIFAVGGVYLTPDLKTPAEWVSWAQLVIAGLIFSRRTQPLAAVGIIVNGVTAALFASGFTLGLQQALDLNRPPG